MTDHIPLGVAPGATQAVTFVQPAEPHMSIDISLVAQWAVAIVAVGALVALVYKLMTRELSRDIAEVRHKTANTTTRVDALERARTEDVARIVKVETTLTGLERGQDRIESTIKDRFDQLAESIREMRHVSPR